MSRDPVRPSGLRDVSPRLRMLEPDTDHPGDRFRGTVMIIAPHMDDEVLACGGLIALLPDRKIHIVYATDGMKSPSPVVSWRDKITPDLGELRMREAERAVGLLGVPRERIHFLGLPEARLHHHIGDLRDLLFEKLERIEPDHVLIPFRYDRHPDHLAVNRVVTEGYRDGRTSASLVEYFVYHRWRLLSGGDLRNYVRPDSLFGVDISPVSELKRRALDCFTTQTTRFYAWQTRPILTPSLLDEECAGPEWFVEFDRSREGTSVFARAVPWILVVHRTEPILQRWKYYITSSVRRLLRLVRRGGG